MQDHEDSWGTASWAEIVSQVRASCSFELHDGLTFEHVSEELEQFWQDKAAAGDELAVECKEIAATVDGLPIAPCVTMLRKAHQDALRLQKFLLATASKLQRRSTPFRGYTQGYLGVTAGCDASHVQSACLKFASPQTLLCPALRRTGSAKTILFEALGTDLFTRIVQEVTRLEKGQETLTPAIADAISYVRRYPNMYPNGDIAGLKTAGTAACTHASFQRSTPGSPLPPSPHPVHSPTEFDVLPVAGVAGWLKADPGLWRIRMSVPEGEEWLANIEKGKSPSELSAWTKMWDTFNAIAKGTHSSNYELHYEELAHSKSS